MPFKSQTQRRKFAELLRTSLRARLSSIWRILPASPDSASCRASAENGCYRVVMYIFRRSERSRAPTL
jgi:hypothetical protein